MLLFIQIYYLGCSTDYATALQLRRYPDERLSPEFECH
jgi:hypothetical protein